MSTWRVQLGDMDEQVGKLQKWRDQVEKSLEFKKKKTKYFNPFKAKDEALEHSGFDSDQEHFSRLVQDLESHKLEVRKLRHTLK